MVAPFFLKTAGLSVIVSRRDMGYWYDPTNIKLLRISRHFVDAVLANSNAVKKRVHEEERIPDEKITVIYNGYDAGRLPQTCFLNIRAQLAIDDDAPIVGVVANLRPIKRLGDLIRAFALVLKERPATRLLIVGDGEQRYALKQLTKSLGIDQAVHFLGQVDEAAPFVREFTVGVLCSENEGFPNAILEYMGCGKPTICTNVGGMPEIIRHGHNGFLVQTGDVQSLATRIKEILLDRELAARLGDNARQDLSGKFHIREMVNAQMDFYEKIVADRT